MHLPDDCGCKVDYVGQKYDIHRLDERIRRRRVNENFSLRDLEAYVNTRVLRAAMRHAEMDVLEGQAEDYYTRLDGDEGSIKRRELRRHLQKEGVDVEELLDDFVCYQTVRKHLNKCLDISTSEDSEPDLRKSRNQIGALTTRVEKVVCKIVKRLRKHGMLDIGEPEVLVNVKVRCTECDRSYTPVNLFENRGCGCEKAGEQGDRTRPAEVQ